jgi:hypothetical protein
MTFWAGQCSTLVQMRLPCVPTAMPEGVRGPQPVWRFWSGLAVTLGQPVLDRPGPDTVHSILDCHSQLLTVIRLDSQAALCQVCRIERSLYVGMLCVDRGSVEGPSAESAGAASSCEHGRPGDTCCIHACQACVQSVASFSSHYLVLLASGCTPTSCFVVCVAHCVDQGLCLSSTSPNPPSPPLPTPEWGLFVVPTSYHILLHISYRVHIVLYTAVHIVPYSAWFVCDGSWVPAGSVEYIDVAILWLQGDWWMTVLWAFCGGRKTVPCERRL